MKALSILLALSLLGLNGVGIYFEERSGGLSPFSERGSEDESQALDDLHVTVGPQRYGDLAIYDYKVVAESYSNDKGEGRWDLFRLTLTGTLTQSFKTDQAATAEDGFDQKHPVVQAHQETRATFILHVESSDGEPLDIPGSIEGTRDVFTTIAGKVDIKALTHGYVQIDRLPRSPKPLEYTGDLRSYTNPSLPQFPSLDEQLLVAGQAYDPSANGSITVASGDESDWLELPPNTIYNWSAERAEIVNGYPAVVLNITSSFFAGLVDFNEQIWIGNDAAFPIKRVSYTNASWNSSDSSGYLFLKTMNTIRPGGFVAGTPAIPWAIPAPIFRTTHQKAEFAPWHYMPAQGAGFASSSFDWGQDDAIEYAIDHSPGLQSFLDRYDRPERPVTITGASYNATPTAADPEGKAGTYWWNLTFGYDPTPQERRDAYERYQAGEEDAYDFSYQILIRKDVARTINPLDPYSESYTIERDLDQQGTAEFNKKDLSDHLVTIASAEQIFKADPEVFSAMFRRTDGEIQWSSPGTSTSGTVQTKFNLGQTGLTGTGAGTIILQTLTGISMPSSRYGWMMQKGQIFTGSDTFIAAIDSESGQRVSVASVSGTSLLGVFG